MTFMSALYVVAQTYKLHIRINLLLICCTYTAYMIKFIAYMLSIYGTTLHIKTIWDNSWHIWNVAYNFIILYVEKVHIYCSGHGIYVNSTTYIHISLAYKPMHDTLKSADILKSAKM